MTKELKLHHLFTCLALAVALTFSACSPKAPSSSDPSAPVSPGGSDAKPAITSAHKNSFAEVTAQLDPRGDFYLYLSTERWLEGLSKSVVSWKNAFSAAPNLTPEDKAAIGIGFDSVTRLIRDAGVEEISGLGVSGIAREKGLFRTKLLLHHYPGKEKGFVWSMLGSKPHTLDGLDYLPATTAFATFSDLDLPKAWQVIEKQLDATGVPEAKKIVAETKALAEKELGMSLDKLFGSMGGEVGFILTLDETKKMPLPFPSASGEPAQMPEPGFMFVVRVKDQTLFNLVDSKLPPSQQMIKVDEAGLKMRTMPLPLPFPLRPTVAQSGDYFFFASTDKLLKEALAVKKGEVKGLKSTPEFIRLSQDVPLQGNGFNYISQRFGRTWSELQLLAMQSAANKATTTGSTDTFTLELMKKFMDPASANMSFNVFSNTDSGWLVTGNTTQEPAKILIAAGATLTVPIIAGMAFPAFAKGREKAQQNVCIANLKMIDGATQQWALETRKTDKSRVNLQAVAKYLKNGVLPTCPNNGTYSVTIVEEAPKCSHPGHALP
ncbi:MAG TPA: hypothetical protein VGH19_13165 [Verrucomicrobiae bacterium]